MKQKTEMRSTGRRAAPTSERRAEEASAATEVDAAARLDTSMIASLKDLRGKKDPSLFNQLYQGFAQRAHAAQSGIAAAATLGDWATALLILHEHRSTSGFLGLALYTRRCGELETLAREACEGKLPAMQVWRAAFAAAAVELQPSLDALDAHVGAGQADSARNAQGAAPHAKRG